MSDSTNNPNNPPELPEDLRGALDGWQVPEASAGFRARQRHAFLAAAKAGAPISEEEAAARLDSWETEPAREEFRAMLRERFLVAAEEYREDEDEDIAAHELRPVSAPQASRRAPAPKPALPRLAGSVLAVAAAGLLYFGLGGPSHFGSAGPVESLPQDPSFSGWQTVNFVQGDEVLLDGRVKMSGADERLGAAVTLGDCSIETGDGKLAMIHYGEGVLLEFPAETKLRFPPVSKGEQGLIEIEVLHGGLRVATTEEFMGRILVHTPHTTIALSGPSMGIDVMDEGTCLCALTGDAEIRPLKTAEGCAGEYEIGSQSMRFVRPCGTVDEFPEGEVHHSKELETFAELGDKYLY